MARRSTQPIKKCCEHVIFRRPTAFLQAKAEAKNEEASKREKLIEEVSANLLALSSFRVSTVSNVSRSARHVRFHDTLISHSILCRFCLCPDGFFVFQVAGLRAKNEVLGERCPRTTFLA